MYLGIDLGTSSVKVVLMDDHFKIAAQQSASLTISRPKPLWSEQDPADWWQATCDAVTQLKNTVPQLLAKVKAIGLSGQMHGATLLDKNDHVLRPAILWNDGRSQQQCDELIERLPEIVKISCNNVMPGFTAPKLLWVKEHEPKIFQQVAKVLLPKDYLRLKISGDYATDLSDASGTSWLNVAKRCWSDEALAACDLSQNNMPKVYEGTEITGKILPQIAQQWGLSENVVIAAGGGDNASAAISMNVMRSGSAFLSLGTSGVYFIASDQCKPNPKRGVHTFAHCIPRTWHSMNCHLSAANCVSWFAELTQSEVTTLAESTEHHKSSEPLIFLPYLSGERSPHNNPYARGMFFGLSHSTTRENMLQAILEGVAFNFKDGQDALDEAHIQTNDIYVVGGGSRSYYWGKILAAILNKELKYCENSDVGAALGAARLAYLAVHKTDPLKTFPADKIVHTIQPDPKLVNYYQKIYPVYKKLYQNNSNLYDQLYNNEGVKHDRNFQQCKND